MVGGQSRAGSGIQSAGRGCANRRRVAAALGRVHRGCLPVMQQGLDEESAGIGDRLAQLRVHPLATDELLRVGFSQRMFKNINTTEDWEEMQRESEK